MLALATTNGCAVHTASVKQAYLAERLAMVDATRPCDLDAFDTFQIKVIHNRVVVPLLINGVPTAGILDTGAEMTLITPELAAAAHATALKLTARYQGVAGSFETRLATLGHVQLGSVSFGFPVIAGIFPFGGSKGIVIGVQLGRNWLSGLDYDLDFPHGTMRPFRTANCVTVSPPWRHTYTGLVLSYARNGITVPVSFQGGDVDAVLDTGSTNSLLSHTAAIRAGATGAELEADQEEKSVGINGKERRFYRHRFKELAIGEEEIHDFPVFVARYFDRRDIDMLLGMDFIGTHHLWLSFTTQALYIDSGEPVQPTAPLDQPHRIAGSQQPIFPAAAAGQTGTVNAQCMVEADGKLTDCRILSDDANKLFAKATMYWLTNGAGPVMQPAYLNGAPVRKLASFSVKFAKP